MPAAVEKTVRSTGGQVDGIVVFILICNVWVYLGLQLLLIRSIAMHNYGVTVTSYKK